MPKCRHWLWGFLPSMQAAEREKLQREIDAARQEQEVRDKTIVQITYYTHHCIPLCALTASHLTSPHLNLLSATCGMNAAKDIVSYSVTGQIGGGTGYSFVDGVYRAFLTSAERFQCAYCVLFLLSATSARARG